MQNYGVLFILFFLNQNRTLYLFLIKDVITKATPTEIILVSNFQPNYVNQFNFFPENINCVNNKCD